EVDERLLLALDRDASLEQLGQRLVKVVRPELEDRRDQLLDGRDDEPEEQIKEDDPNRDVESDTQGGNNARPGPAASIGNYGGRRGGGVAASPDRRAHGRAEENALLARVELVPERQRVARRVVDVALDVDLVARHDGQNAGDGAVLLRVGVERRIRR